MEKPFASVFPKDLRSYPLTLKTSQHLFMVFLKIGAALWAVGGKPGVPNGPGQPLLTCPERVPNLASRGLRPGLSMELHAERETKQNKHTQVDLLGPWQKWALPEKLKGWMSLFALVPFLLFGCMFEDGNRRLSARPTETNVSCRDIRIT